VTPVQTLIGRWLRPLRASAARSPLAGRAFDAPDAITVSSPAFVDGAAIPRRHAGRGVGDDVSPELQWTGVPPGASALVLWLDDVDVPLRAPLVHSIAVLDPGATGLAEGAFLSGAPGVRIVATMLGRNGYSGPRPIPGHGRHHYRFQLLALDRSVPDDTTSVKALLGTVAGHVIARGLLTGSYER
jgi:phosphatidylethanolamine-binding protein (PEBP) family uncharacterized protein